MCSVTYDLGRDKSIRNMPITLWQRVKVLALKRGVAVREIVILALERYLKTEK